MSAVDPDTCRARVKFPDKAGAESFWLEVLQQNTHANKGYWLPDVGELVAVMTDGKKEAGCILGAIYTDENKPPAPSGNVRRVTFGDGTVVEYDRTSHVLKVTGGDVKVIVGGGASPVALEVPLTQALNTLKSAIASAPVTPGDGGSAFKASLVGALGAFPGTLASERLETD